LGISVLGDPDVAPPHLQPVARPSVDPQHFAPIHLEFPRGHVRSTFQSAYGALRKRRGNAIYCFVCFARKITALDRQQPTRGEAMNAFRSSLTLAVLGMTAGVLTSSATAQSKPVDTTPSKHLEIIHHPNYDKTVFMPFVPAIKIKSGKIVWLAGGT